MPRVLLLFEYATLNGGERSLLAILQRLCTRREFSFAALAPACGPLAVSLAALGIDVLPLALANDGRRVPQDAIRAQLATVIDQLKPDLVHANSLAMGRLVGPVAAGRGVPSVSHLRDIIGLSTQAVRDLNQNSRLLVVSSATRDHHVAQGLAADKTFVVYNGIDFDRFRPRTATDWLHRELGLEPQTILIGTIGQLVQRKGLDVLAAAATMLAETHPQVHYVIIGERYSSKDEALRHEISLREQFSLGPLAGRAHFLGVRSDVAEILPELTLLVHPARQEPLGRVLLEAAASGVPVVATDVGGTREILPSGTGWLVPPGDASALANGIQTLLRDAELRANLAQSALDRARSQFDVRNAAEQLASQYAAVLQTQSVRNVTTTSRGR